jgi:hypothetical protein
VNRVGTLDDEEPEIRIDIDMMVSHGLPITVSIEATGNGTGCGAEPHRAT